mgnify:CR=1 FL=1
MKTTKMLFFVAILAFSSYTFGQGWGTTQCDEPIKIGIPQITANTLTVTWLAKTEGVTTLEVGEYGFVPGTGSMLARGIALAVPNAVNEISAEGLPENTTLVFYMKTDCEESSSSWVGPIKFRTKHVTSISIHGER